MDKKKKILIYPYDLQSTPYLRHKELFKDYEIAAVVSPSGWGLGGSDAGIADGGFPVGIMVRDSFEEALAEVDAVLFAESAMKLDFKKIIRPKMLRAVEAGKSILCTLNLEEEDRGELTAACKSMGVGFRYFGFRDDWQRFDKIPMELFELVELKTSIAFVVGLAERTNKYELQLALAENAAKMGYKVALVGSRRGSELLDFHSFPDFMFSKHIEEARKIVLFNRFIKKIEIEENPDLIIIGIPGGIMPFNNMITNRFGVLAYEASMAVTPDFVAFSMLYEDYGSEFIDNICTSIRYKLGYEVDCINMGNAKFDWEISRYERKPQYITLEAQFVDEKKKKYTNISNNSDRPVFNILNKEDATFATEYMINKLQGYNIVESV